MSWAAFEAFAQIAVGRVLNSLPESLLIVLSAALLARLAGRRSSGTRFAVWMIAFCATTALPFLGLGSSHGPFPAATPRFHPEVTVSSLWAVGLLGLWIPLALLALARLLAGLLRLRSIRNHCREIAPAALAPMLRTALTEHAGGRAVRLVTCDSVRIPMAIGFRRPAVVLPSWALEELPADQLRPILIHELTHLARRDDWTNLLQKFVRAVFCFHPALWWVDAKLSRERELACDDAVLVATADPHAYASSLLGLLEKSGFRRGWTMAQAAVGRACEATQRITRILTGARPATTRISRSVLAAAAVASAACAGLLLAAPRLIVFGPEAPAAVAPAFVSQDAGLESPQPRLLRSSVPAVAAAWHPRRADAPNLLFRGAERPPQRPPAKPRRIEAARSPRSTDPRTPRQPQLRLATLNTSAVTPTPTFLVFEAPAVSAQRPVEQASAVPEPRPGQPAAFIETVQFIEQDAAGIHVQILHLVVLGPARLPAPPAEGVSQTI